jgi:lipopolysaccharide biosynthesis protein
MADLMLPASCSVVFHNYYGGHEDWVRFFCERMTVPFNLFYNIVEDSLFNLEHDRDVLSRMEAIASGTFLKRIILRKSPNKGKDIGGKLVLLDAGLKEGIVSDYYIFLHDKKSHYKSNGPEWRDKLFRIVEPSFVQKALAHFAQDRETGIVAAKDTILNEYDYSTGSFASNNRDKLEALQKEYSIDTTDHRYVAGTMFWARAAPVVDFFRRYPPLDLRETLESGNVLDDKTGTNTHSWERMLSWLIFAQGYRIKGL